MEVVRFQSAGALGLIDTDGPRVAPVLIKALHDSQSEVRRAAAFDLWNLGPKARAAVPALTEAVNDPSEKVRQAACRALQKVRGAP